MIHSGDTFITADILKALGLPTGTVTGITIYAEVGRPVEIDVRMFAKDEIGQVSGMLAEQVKRFRLEPLND